MSGNIIRVKKPEKYAIVSQDMLRDNRLSFAARGLLSYLLSKPTDWEMRTEDLIAQSPAGRDAVYAMLKELETFGYLKRARVRDDKGHVSWATTVFESPELASPYRGSPNTAEPDTARPNTEKPHSKEVLSNELPKKERKRKTPSPDGDAPPKKVPAIKLLPVKDQNILEVWKVTTKYYPKESMWPTVLSRLRDGFDPERLRRCGGAYLVYNGMGARHVGGILDWYDRNQTTQEGNGHGQVAKPQFGKPPVTRDFNKYPARTG